MEKTVTEIPARYVDENGDPSPATHTIFPQTFQYDNPDPTSFEGQVILSEKPLIAYRQCPRREISRRIVVRI